MSKDKQTSSRTPLPYKHVSDAVAQALEYMDGRRKGTVKSLKTSFPKLNKALLAGVEWGRIFTIAGLSGSGKSTICEQLKRDFVDYNKDQDFDILSFEFEMLGQDQVARNLSGKLDTSTKQLYSADVPLSDSQFDRVKELSKEIAEYPIYYVDDIGSVEDIRDTIIGFIEEQQLMQRQRGLVVTVDHVLLTKGRMGEDEKITIDRLTHLCVQLRKYYSSRGMKIIFILLSQLNRNIETPERVLNPELHYPTKNDIFGASSLFYSSDYVLITHKPSVINGMGKYYGPAREGYKLGLPVYNPSNPKQAMIYWHLIKERFGEQKTLMMVDEFRKSSVGEYKPL